MVEKKTKTMRLVIFTDIIDREFFGANGGVSTLTKEAATLVKNTAVDLIGSTYSGEHPGRRLRNSGAVVPSDIGPPDWMVRFTHRAAAVHHEGARSHMMGEEGKRFYRAPGSEVINGIPQPYTPGGGFGPVRSPFRRGRMDHPGHAANRYLTNAARDVGLKVSQTPGGRFGRRGFARVPRGFV